MKTEARRQKAEGRRCRTAVRHPSSVICYQGFTLIEIVVAIGILVMVVGFAGVIFQRSIGSYRMACAQAEVMRKLRVITEQLDNDFRGLRKDAPMFIWFQRGVTSATDANRFDQIMFFADGDFQSIQTYAPRPSDGKLVPSSTGSPIASNIARIQYSQANNPAAIPDYDRLLARRQHLYIVNPPPPQPQYVQFPLESSGIITIFPVDNNSFEHDTNSLSQWQAAAQNSTNVDEIIIKCFGDTAFNYNNNRPEIDKANANTLHLLMIEGVGSFSVQWSYFYTDVSGQKHIYWWPSIDPDGNGDISDSDFGPNPPNPLSMNRNSFGFYFNSAAPVLGGWFSHNGATGSYYPSIKPAFPQALKFTFTLYDSRRMFPQGQTFTHIVYLGD